MVGVLINIFNIDTIEAIEPIMNMIEKNWFEEQYLEERRVMIRSAQWARLIIACAYSMWN